MIVTATELKENMGKYLSLVTEEDIIITKNGKQIARLTDVKDKRLNAAYALFGALHNDIDIKDIRSERLANK